MDIYPRPRCNLVTFVRGPRRRIVGGIRRDTNVRFPSDSVAKLSLRRLAIRDSFR